MAEQDLPVCAQCLKHRIDETDVDDENVFWTYCANCHFWTEHGKLPEAD